MRPLTREELLALPATTDLPTLGRAFGISEPTARERHRRGEWAQLGIRILRFGQKWRVITADVLEVLGIEPGNGAPPVGQGEQHADAQLDPLPGSAAKHGQTPLDPDRRNGKHSAGMNSGTR